MPLNGICLDAGSVRAEIEEAPQEHGLDPEMVARINGLDDQTINTWIHELAGRHDAFWAAYDNLRRDVITRLAGITESGTKDNKRDEGQRMTYSIAQINLNTVVVLDHKGRVQRIHRQDADPEHRHVEHRLAAAWFGNLPQVTDCTHAPERPRTQTEALQILEMIHALDGEHPWLPGSIFVDRPGLAQRLSDLIVRHSDELLD